MLLLFLGFCGLG